MQMNIIAGIRTLRTILIFYCCLLSAAGDEMITLQEVEGTTITLHTGNTGIQSDSEIHLFYGPEKAEKEILNSQMYKGETFTEISERFKERLQLDRTSVTLTIRNISRNLSGVYLLQVNTERLYSRTFRVNVYAPVSTPVINLSGKRSEFSTEPCSLMCSVENGEDVKLSWYRENKRISITNNTDLSVPLNLSLQIQHHDNNTYICVSANPVSNKTTSLNITQLCFHHSELYDPVHLLLAVLLTEAVLFIVSLCIFRKQKKQRVPETPDKRRYTDVNVPAHSEKEVKTRKDKGTYAGAGPSFFHPPSTVLLPY